MVEDCIFLIHCQFVGDCTIQNVIAYIRLADK